MHRTLASCLLALLPGAALGALPPVGTLDVARSGDDLVISWSPLVGADGYRIYRSSDLRCTERELVYEGSATSWTDPGALADQGVGLYQLHGFDASGEGEPTEPVYRYPFALSEVGPNLVGHPYAYGPGPQMSDMCRDLQDQGLALDMVTVFRHELEQGLLASTLICGLFDQDLEPGSPVALHGFADGAAVMWGHGHPPLALALYGGGDGDPVEIVDANAVSLPYDHAYADLRQLARELPGLLAAWLWLPGLVPFERGLRRAPRGEPWSGENLDLRPQRQRGLILELDSDYDFTPRRLCGTPCPVPLGRVEPLLAVKSGEDVTLSWTPRLLADGGYLVYRTALETELPDITAQPELATVPETEPVFPLVDVGAVSDPASDVYYYQAVARCPDGSLGEL